MDLKAAEWIEFTERDGRMMRIAVDKSSHLPLRWVVVTRDATARGRSESATTYAQFHSVGGVLTPFKISRTQDGREIFQVFFTSCKYNSNLSPELFTRDSLEQRYAEVGPRGYEGGKNGDDKK